MANKPNQGGGGGMPSFVKTIIKFFMVFGVIFAVFHLPSNITLKTVWNSVVTTTNQVAGWANHIGGAAANGKIDLGIGINTPKPLVLNPQDASISLNGKTFNLQNLLTAAQAIPSTGYNANVAYNRYEWRHWDNITSCWTVREEVLYRDAKKGEPVTMHDKDGNLTTDKSKACDITGGTWIDPYTGQTFTNPSDLDIDHVIPLGYAARAGGQIWDSNKKMDYANDLSYDYHLLAVSASANRSKSDSGPSQWVPREEYQCQYGVAWTVIANKWNLALNAPDKSKIQELLAKCAK